MNIFDQARAMQAALDARKQPPGFGEFYPSGTLNVEFSDELDPPLPVIMNDPLEQRVLLCGEQRTQARDLGGEVQLVYYDLTNDVLYYVMGGKKRFLRRIIRTWSQVKHAQGSNESFRDQMTATDVEALSQEMFSYSLTNNTRISVPCFRFYHRESITNAALYVLTALVNRQAKGEDIVKGLYAQLSSEQIEWCATSLKITLLSAGGVAIQRNGVKFTVGDFLTQVQEATANR